MKTVHQEGSFLVTATLISLCPVTKVNGVLQQYDLIIYYDL